MRVIDDVAGIGIDEDALIAEAEQLLPEIGRHMHFAVLRHPASSGLSVAQLKGLMHVHHHGQSTVGELAHGLGLSMPAASELIDRLVELGYLERGANPLDRRQVLVELTPKAHAFSSQIHALRIAQLRAAFERLEPAERPTFVRSLRIFAEVLRLQAHELPGCPDAATLADSAATAGTTNS
jgi:DNA-binding MarR family transcriptional regulator